MMQGVRSPFLRLDNLVVGDYTFRLKVTDAAGQESTADVRVFVKPGLQLHGFVTVEQHIYGTFIEIMVFSAHVWIICRLKLSAAMCQNYLQLEFCKHFSVK